ncbi:hypothetical protein KUTeg_022515 [Tegillarca granosa]|uniref:G-protein coupled receptors family 1 profile domain-containing protein n=1 Tax=Tegillarca granosa TaxID=220873 RepID=A0ABQ9E6E9_TEGGR|nr:hypothetical protein KUTeg_022515 [Tegillarca granosa]
MKAYCSVRLGKLTNYLMVTCMSVSTLTLIAVGVDQYFAVVHPVFTFLACRRSGRAVLEITAIWIISLLSFISVFVLSEEIDVFGYKFCQINWERSQHQAYTAVVTVVFYILPQIILGFCYIQLARKMRQSMHNQQTQLTEVTLKIRRRVVRLVFIVTLAFVLCWLPLHLSAVNGAFNMSDSVFFYNLRLFSPCFSFLTTAINPIIYCFFNRTFRKFFKATFTCKNVVINGPLVGEEAEAYVRNTQRATISREQNRPRPPNQNIDRPLLIQVRPASNVYVAPDLRN